MAKHGGGKLLILCSQRVLASVKLNLRIGSTECLVGGGRISCVLYKANLNCQIEKNV